MSFYSELGYGHKARVLYVLWIASVLVVLAFGARVLDYSWELNSGFFKWVIGGGIAGLFALYAWLSTYDRVSENKKVRRAFKQGKGGSARFGGSGTYAKYEWGKAKKAPIYLGRSLGQHDPRPGGRDIGVDDESHMVTIAQSGAGKSVTVIWPNLVKYPYPDSVFVLDPKGEHAQNTSGHRSAMGQRVIVLDPFEMTNGLQLHGLNPLAHLDVNSPRAAEDIKAIADACVIPAAKSDATDQHFDNLKRAMIAGVIAQTISSEPKQNHNLPFVYERLMDLGDEKAFENFLNDMRHNSACGDLPRRAVTLYEMAGKNEKGSIFTSTIACLEWVASDGMRELLLRDDFQFSQIRTEQMSVYVVLDFDAMKPDRQGRFMRVMMNLAFQACRDIPLPADRSRRRTLFILDEVAQVGSMPSLKSAYQTLRSYNTKIWAFYQQFQGLADQVDDTTAITGNSTKQFFGCEDEITAEAIEKLLGKYKHYDGVREFQRSLLDAQEIDAALGQQDLVQFVKTGAGDLMELTRVRFIPGNASSNTNVNPEVSGGSMSEEELRRLEEDF